MALFVLLHEKNANDSPHLASPADHPSFPPAGRLRHARSTAGPVAMQIWVDADACPGVIKEIIFRAAERRQIQTTLVANQMLRTPPSRFIRAIQVPSGFDVADFAVYSDH